MRFAFALIMLCLAGCEDKRPEGPTAEESARLDEADALLNEAASNASAR